MRKTTDPVTGIDTITTNVDDQNAAFAVAGSQLHPTLAVVFDACETLDAFTAASVLGGLHYLLASSAINLLARNMPRGPGSTDPLTGEVMESTLDSRYEMDQALETSVDPEVRATMKGLLDARNDLVTHLSGINPELADKMTLDSTLEFMVARPPQGKDAFNAEFTASRRAGIPTFGVTRQQYVEQRVKEAAQTHEHLVSAASLAVMALDCIDCSRVESSELPEWMDEAIPQKALSKLYDARIKKGIRGSNPRTRHETRMEIVADIMAIDRLIRALGGTVPVEIQEEAEPAADEFGAEAGDLSGWDDPKRTFRRVSQ